jgi:PAS domain S-box-containing protein
MAEMLGYTTPEELIGLATDISQQILVSPQKFSILVEEMILARDWIQKQARLRTKNGHIIIANLKGRKVANLDNSVSYFELFAEDVTQKTLVFEMLSKNTVSDH